MSEKEQLIEYLCSAYKSIECINEFYDKKQMAYYRFNSEKNRKDNSLTILAVVLGLCAILCVSFAFYLGKSGVTDGSMFYLISVMFVVGTVGVIFVGISLDKKRKLYIQQLEAEYQNECERYDLALRGNFGPLENIPKRYRNLDSLESMIENLRCNVASNLKEAIQIYETQRTNQVIMEQAQQIAEQRAEMDILERDIQDLSNETSQAQNDAMWAYYMSMQ